MLDTDPHLALRDLLRAEWDATNTSLHDANGNPAPPRTHTGWYDYGAADTQVTITNQSENVVGGGETGQSAGSGDGRAVQIRAGTVLVNGWSGTRDHLDGLGPNGGRINPKQMSYELANEIHSIVQDNASGTTDDNGDTVFRSLGADSVRAIPETDAPEFVHRREVVVRYTYVDHAERA